MITKDGEEENVELKVGVHMLNLAPNQLFVPQ